MRYEVTVPRRVGLLSVHTSPLEQPGAGDSGGMNVSIRELGRRLGERGVAVDIFTRAAGADLPSVIAVDGMRVHHVDVGSPGLSKDDLANHLCAFFLAFANHPVARRLDLVHAHYWMSGWVGRQARRRLGIPLVQSFHTLGHVKNAALAAGDVPEPPLRLAAEERIVAEADAVIAPTRTEADVLQERYGAPAGRVHVVQPGVDLATFRPEENRLALRHSLGGGRIILFVGRLQPLKGPDTAVQTLAALGNMLPDDGLPTRLVVVGGPSGSRGVDAVQLRRLAAQLGVADRLAVLAPRPHAELAKLYQAADAVLVPSHSESFGLVALEALASGTPVVAAAVGGLTHLLASGGGSLVTEHTPEAYAAALVPYLVNETVRLAAGRAGRRRAAAFSWDQTAEGTIEVYEHVLGVSAVHSQLTTDVRGA